MDAVLTILKILGALGVFLFGMKVMSEALQKVAGKRLKGLLARITSNRFFGVFTGFTITTVIQSSSATTVMLVGFVNAKLMNLRQAIGVIMGANIGTTVTGWLVALLGFKVKLTAFALPAVGIGFFIMFINRPQPKQWGEALLGFGLLFLGLHLLKGGVPEVNHEQLAWVQDVSGYGFPSMLLAVAIGTGLTVVLQSSSATMTLTLTMTASGWIPYDMAAAMILGENIGTTATANIAAIGTTRVAKQAARAHFLFNIFGVLWALALMNLAMLPLTDALVPGDPTAIGDADTYQGVVTAHLAAFHTAFNIINTGMMLPFVNQLATIVSRWVPEREEDEPKRRVSQYISNSLVQTPELVLVQVGKEMQRMSEVVRRMFGDAMYILTHPDEDLGTLVEETMEREQLLDDLDKEIAAVLAMTARASTSAWAAQKITRMALNTHRLERIGDHCEYLVKHAIANRGVEGKDRLDAESIEELAAFGELVDRSIENLGRYLVGETDVTEAAAIEDQIDATRDRLRESHVKRMRETGNQLVPGLRTLQIIHHLEEIGDRCFGIIMRDTDEGSLPPSVIAAHNRPRTVSLR